MGGCVDASGRVDPDVVQGRRRDLDRSLRGSKENENGDEASWQEWHSHHCFHLKCPGSLLVFRRLRPFRISLFFQSSVFFQFWSHVPSDGRGPQLFEKGTLAADRSISVPRR
jgi:hypothetical protein